MSAELEAGDGRGAFSSTTEVGDASWRAVMVGGCLLRSLLKPILPMTAGGGGEARRQRENQWSYRRPSSGSARLPHSHGSQSSLLLFIHQLDPCFPFISPHLLAVCLRFCRLAPLSVLLWHFSSFSWRILQYCWILLLLIDLWVQKTVVWMWSFSIRKVASTLLPSSTPRFHRDTFTNYPWGDRNGGI